VSRFLLGSLTILLGATVVNGQDRPPVRESVHVVVASTPRLLRIDGTRVLVWELHLRNGRADSLEVVRLQAFDGKDSARAVVDASGAALVRDLQSLQRGVSLRAPQWLAAGETRAFYGWAPLSGSPPRTVRHVVHVRVPDAADPLLVRVGAVAVRASSGTPLAAPLRGGPWVAIYLPEVAGGHRRAAITVDGQTRIPGRFAIDWVRLRSDGRLAPANASVRNGFGSEVLAVAPGRIVAARDDMADNTDSAGRPRPKFDLAHESGNYVALALADGRVVWYEHLRAGSVRVRPGERVGVGTVLGELGYSGSSSIGPHLHLHVADRPSLLGAEGEPLAFSSFTELGRFGTIGELLSGAPYAPARRPFDRAFPASLAVLEFPLR